MRRSALACAIMAAGLGTAHAQAPESLYTELLKGRCKFVSIDMETNEEQVKRCPGHGGAQAQTRASHTSVYLSFRFGRRDTDDIVLGWSLGDKVEWRGMRTPKGFEPYATIVRVITKDPETLVAGGHVLAVMRMEKGNACLAAAVEVASNKDPNLLAREAADTYARTFVCGKDAPRVFGAAGAPMQQVIGTPPKEAEPPQPR